MLALLAALLVQAHPAVLAGAPPPSEAMRLARELAETGTRATLMPMLVADDLDALARERPALTPDQQTRLKAIGQAIARRRRHQILDAMAGVYARRLTVAELATLTATSRTAAARAKRAADVPATMAAMTSVGAVDLKRETAAEPCRETKLFCDR